MKKILLYLIIIIILGIGFTFFNTIYFSGTEKIKILNDYDKISSLNELINHSDFINKNLYIDYYSTSCSSAINQFKYFPDLKKDINQEDLVFVHMSAPNNIYNWKSGIKNHQLEDYNLLMTEEFHKEFWTNFPERIKAPPFYLLVNKEKEIKESSFPEHIKMSKYVGLVFTRISDYVNNNLDELKQKLQELFNRKIDLITERTLSNPYFIESVDESKKLIYEA